MDTTGKIGAKTDLDNSTLFGVINSQSKTIIKPINSAISHIKESANLLTSSVSFPAAGATSLAQFKAPYTGIMGIKCSGGTFNSTTGYYVGTSPKGSNIAKRIYHNATEANFIIEVVKDTIYYISYYASGTSTSAVTSVVL